MKTISKHLTAFALTLTALSLPSIASAEAVPTTGWKINDFSSAAQSVGISITPPSGILSNIINYALLIIGFLGVLAFIISGIMYLVSAGDEDSAKTAKSYMINAIIGIIVALLGFVVMAAISTLVGAGGATSGL